MNDEKKVSIIMAAYNAEKYIKYAIDSVINQTYNNWELIICDDCSTDNTHDIVKEYSLIDSRIKLIRNEKNSRQSKSRNNAFEKSDGQYIAILDADDSIHEDKIKKQVLFLENNPQYSFVGTNAYIIDDNNKITGTIKKLSNPKESTVIRNKGFVYSSIMVRRDVFEKIEGYTVSSITKTGEDYDLICKIYQEGLKGTNILEELYFYRVNPGNYQRRNYEAYYNEFKVAMKHVKNGWLKVNECEIYIVFYLFAPLIKGLVPSRLMRCYHNIKFKGDK